MVCEKCGQAHSDGLLCGRGVYCPIGSSTPIDVTGFEQAVIILQGRIIETTIPQGAKRIWASVDHEGDVHVSLSGR